MRPNPMLTDVMQALYRSEINCSVTSFWDDGWTVRLGDDLNGFKAERNFTSETFGKAAAWLGDAAKRAYPDSKFAKEWNNG